MSVYTDFHDVFGSCWACEHQPLPRELTRGLAGKIEAAHIVGGAGRAKDRRALVSLCKIHHLVQEGERVVSEGKPLPKVTLANMLWLKMRHDLDYYDHAFIIECRKRKNGIQVAPEPLPLDPILTDDVIQF